MTEELVDDLSHVRRKHMRKSAPKYTFPGSRYGDKSHQKVGRGLVERHTLAVDPEQGASRLPLFEKTASEKPVCGSPVLRAAQDNMIRG